MRVSYSSVISNERKAQDFAKSPVRIGRDTTNDLVLVHPSIAPEAAILHLKNGAWEVISVGNAIRVGERRLTRGERPPVANGLVLKLWPFTLTVNLPESALATDDQLRRGLDLKLSALLGAIHLELLKRMDLASRASSQREETEEYHFAIERQVEEIAQLQGLFAAPQAGLAYHIAGLAAQRHSVEGLLSRVDDKNAWHSRDRRSSLLSTLPERERELQLVGVKVAEILGLPKITDLSQQIQRIETQFWMSWKAIGGDLADDFKQYLVNRYLKKELKDIVFGFGPLEDLLRTPTISEIMVVSRDRIFIEKNGVLENSGRCFISDEVTETIIQRIVAKVGRRIDKSSPLVDARLADGSRVNAVIPPLAVSGPCLTIRKFPLRKLSVADLITRGSLTKPAADFLRAAVLARKNILVSGGTGTGKTTLLNCLSDHIPDKERIVTIEDTAELQLQKTHVVRLETKVANVEGAGAYTIRDLVKNALRMRPDRIVVGECRGAEALDMLQAMNSGHDGSLTTLHSNSARDVVLRLEVLVQMAADLPISSIHRQIASAVDVVVQLHRMRNGRRCVTQITEFVDVDAELGGVQMRDLFLLDEHNEKAGLAPTGALPTFMAELIEGGMLNLETFYQ